jgi:hypothetical protein
MGLVASIDQRHELVKLIALIDPAAFGQGCGSRLVPDA